MGVRFYSSLNSCDSNFEVKFIILLMIWNLPTIISYLVKEHAPPAILGGLETRFLFINFSPIIWNIDFVMTMYPLNLHAC